ncbi:ATP-binding protein [Sulfurimonas sp.]|uniref:ATP-binding protein n=1 Tax=Sulfurimonas sp. TaxID=2022749 RepID=UPI003569F05D
MKNYEDVTPNPEYLIKSIAEQGYSLESALADLIDNSISANANQVEVLIKTDKEPFILYLTDNGDGMDEEALKASMHFPSTSPDTTRKSDDLGRFGLGMKTASFSQTRKFTVLAKKKGSKKYHARTWDLNALKDNKWQIIVNTQAEIEQIINEYKVQSDDNFSQFDNYEPNVIIVWHGLYKYEEYLEEENRRKALKDEINEVTTDHLSLVFHRFMESKEQHLQLRVNNIRLQAFNPFPEKDLRSVEFKQKGFGNDSIKLEGFVLPSTSIEETKESNNTKWTTKYRSLLDMEGIYIYRADRIILFGGWNGLIKKAPRLQLARLRVEIGNKVDHLLHLNVAKSQVIIPHDLKDAFEDYINDLKEEAKKEFFNRGIKKFPKKSENSESLFVRNPSNKGVLLELNPEFSILKQFNEELSSSNQAKLKVLLKMVNTQISNIKQTHEDKVFLGIEQENNISTEELLQTIKGLIQAGINPSVIKKEILPNLGYKVDTYPTKILEVLNGK